jgi:hypothetical protein
MAERGILFKPEMVRARLSGVKTMTRRTRGLERLNSDPEAWTYHVPDEWGRHVFVLRGTTEALRIRCPYGVPGDVLWWKEAWRTGWSLDKMNATQIRQAADDAGFEQGPRGPIMYPLDGVTRTWGDDDARDFGPWGRVRSARFMPRWASRIVTPLVRVSAQRVTDISDDDAIREGVDEWNGGEVARDPGVPRACFRSLWDEINAKRGLQFDRGPWCWVLTMGEVK